MRMKFGKRRMGIRKKKYQIKIHKVWGSLDCIRSRPRFRRNRFWSLDGVFLDDVDPEWIFWQRECELTHRLYTDNIGEARSAQPPPAGAPSIPEAKSGSELYMQQRFQHGSGT